MSEILGGINPFDTHTGLLTASGEKKRKRNLLCCTDTEVAIHYAV